MKRFLHKEDDNVVSVLDDRFYYSEEKKEYYP